MDDAFRIREMCRQSRSPVWPVWRKRYPLFAPRMRPCQVARGDQICAVRVENCCQLTQREVDLSTNLLRLRVDQACRDAGEHMFEGSAAPQCIFFKQKTAYEMDKDSE